LEANDSRRYPPRPVLGVGALIFKGDRILLIERGKEPLKGQWSLPGGAVETGERIEDALIREMLEETGLEVMPTRIAVVFERIMHDAKNLPEYHYLLIDFFCEIRGGSLRAGDDCSNAAWFTFDEVEGLPITVGTREVIRAARSGDTRLTIARP
jgi:ADP-ribose pyrophosphatase YjhB (NUDIX family)